MAVPRPRTQIHPVMHPPQTLSPPRLPPVETGRREDAQKGNSYTLYLLYLKINSIVRAKTCKNVFYRLEQALERHICRKWQPVIFHEAPQNLDQIQFWTIGRQILDDSTTLHPLRHVPDKFSRLLY